MGKFERMVVHNAHGSCKPVMRRSRWGWESTGDRLWAPFLFDVVTDRQTDYLYSIFYNKIIFRCYIEAETQGLNP